MDLNDLIQRGDTVLRELAGWREELDLAADNQPDPATAERLRRMALDLGAVELVCDASAVTLKGMR